MREVSPEMAEKVLSADLRNVIKKVGDGVPLSPSEREMMERYLAASAEMEDLQKARSAALLRRWATGGKLSRAEMREVNSHFEEEGKRGPVRVTSDQYANPLRIYAEQIWPEGNLDSSIRKLKRWVKKGKEADPPDLPPLDDMPRMARWYERHHRASKAPEYLRRFEDQEEKSGATSRPAAPGTETSDEGGEGIAMKLGDGEMESDMGLRQVRRLAEGVFNQMEEAIKRGKTKEYKTLQREYLSLIGTLRQWEKDIIKIQEGKGEVLRTRVVNSELVQIFTAIAQSYYTGLVKLIRELRPEMPGNEVHAMAIERRDAAFLHLKNSRFEPSWKSAREEC